MADAYVDKLLSHPSRVRGLKLKYHMNTLDKTMSHPSRVRGLKFNRRWMHCRKVQVAPFTGAWIEMAATVKILDAIESHPSRVRGLKLKNPNGYGCIRLSHPSRVRGLKYYCPKACQSTM